MPELQPQGCCPDPTNKRVIIDGEQLLLRELMCEGVWEDALDEWTAIEKAAFEEALRDRGSPLLPTDWNQALPILEHIHRVLLARLRELVGRLSPAAWLWHLRRARLPRDAMLEGTWPHARLAAEAISQASDRPPAEFGYDEQCVRCAIEMENAIAVTHLLVGARLLRGCEATTRRVGKGALLDRDAGGLPIAPGDSQFEALLLAYDQRVETDGSFASPSGTLDEPAGDNATGHSILIVLPTPVPRFSKLPTLPRWESEVPGEILVEYVPTFMDDSFLRDLISRRKVSFDNDAAAVLVALHQLLSCAAALFGSASSYALSIVRNGYLVLSDPSAHLLDTDVLRWSADRAAGLGLGVTFNEPDKLLGCIETIPHDAWPAAFGRPLRQMSKGVLIDLVAATHHFHRLLARFGRTGADGKEKGEHFELAVQQLIDETDWRPSDPLRSCRGRTLRLAGRDLTDVDAIASKGDRLLLISCKSIQRVDGYERGDFKAVRNAATTVTEAVEYWNTVADTIRRSPVGDNFDFSTFSTVTAVVVTPWPVWVANGPALSATAPNLPSCVSAAELHRWLKTGQTAR